MTVSLNMDYKKLKYVNPPPPIGYQKKQSMLTLKESNYGENINIHKTIVMILNSKICDEPNVSIYEDFVINPESEDEGALELPFATVLKVVNALDITKDNQNYESLRDTVINSDNGHLSSAKVETSVKDSVHLVENKVSRVTESGCHRSFSKGNKHKKHVMKEKHFKKSSCKRKKFKCDEEDDSDSTDINEMYTSSRKCIKKECSTNRDSHSRSPLKKEENYTGDSNYHSRSLYKKVYGSDNDSCGKSRYKKESSSDMDLFSRNQLKKGDSGCINLIPISDSCNNSNFHRNYKKVESYKNSHSYKGLNDSDRNVSGKTQIKQLSDFKRDDDKMKPKTEGNYVKIDRRQFISAPSTSTENSAKEHENSSNINTKQSLLYGEYRCKVLENLQNDLAANQEKKTNLLSSEIQGQQTTDLPSLPFLTPPSSKYPDPPPGYCRKKLNVWSAVQDHLNKISKFPFPGLHKVTEIRSVKETAYYCSFCDINCNCNSIIQHLFGFKHQLNCLKYYRSDLYDLWYYKPKYAIKGKVFDTLKDQEMKYGRGLIRVEEDVRDSDINFETWATKTDFNAHNSVSTSMQNKDYFENYLSNSKPDPTKSGFYCKVCKCSCNSELIWSSHIVGRRHLANLKKMPGSAPSKCKYTYADENVRPYLFDIIEKENKYKSPVVGLQNIREIRKPDINGLMFNCFLCGASISDLEIVNHILSTKHREKYLNEINHPDIEALKDCKISESSRSSILEDICARVEAEEGSGKPEVCYAKSNIKY